MVEAGFADLAIGAQLLVDTAHGLCDDAVALVLDESPSAELLAVQDCLEAAASYLSTGRELLSKKIDLATNGLPLPFEAA